MQPHRPLPNIHMNSTSPGELLEQALAVINACDALAEAIRAAFPNGRDYLSEQVGTYQSARDAATLDLMRVQQLKTEHERLAMHAADARDEQEARRAR